MTTEKERMVAPRDRWSWPIGRVRGIAIRVHATFSLILVWVALNSLISHEGLMSALNGVGYVLAVFAIIVAHELAHALTARRFGIATRDILLLPIGGVSRLERLPSKPSEEFLVAVAGPMLNVALAAVLFGVLAAAGASKETMHLTVSGGSLLVRLMWTNIALAVFNLLPAFPMDGGRVLRSLLALHMDYARATDISATVGQSIALVFALVGFFFNPVLVFIALFVWVGAGEEARRARARTRLSGVTVSRAMARHFATVAPTEPVSTLASYLLEGFQDEIPVVEGGRLVGMVDRQGVLRAMAENRESTPASFVMRRSVDTVSEHDPLHTAMERLEASGRRSLPVVRGDVLVGLLPAENIAYFLRVRKPEPPVAAHG